MNKQRDLIQGQTAEHDFYIRYKDQIERAGSRWEDMGKNIDFVLNSGLCVDVKGYKKVKSGFVCIEVINTQGNKGWCHPFSGVDLISFEIGIRKFHTVSKNELLHFTKNKAGDIPVENDVIRSNTNWTNPRLYEWRGRQHYQGEPRKDVFTFITLNDLMNLKSYL